MFALSVKTMRNDLAELLVCDKGLRKCEVCHELFERPKDKHGAQWDWKCKVCKEIEQ